MLPELRTSLLALSALALFSGSAIAQEEEDLPTWPLSEDNGFNFDLLIPMGMAIYGGSDIAPMLRAAKMLEPGNFEVFTEVLYALANETKAAANDPRNAYDALNVQETNFHAAQYFRRTDNYLHDDWNDPLIYTLWDEQKACFDKAIATLPIPGKRIQVEADNFTVEAIWYAASAEKGAHNPTFIFVPGYDGAQEDAYHTLVVPALARGWNVLTSEGPGQPTVRRDQDIGFIHDWERVMTPLVDYLLTNQSDAVDEKRLAIYGMSFGGYLAARAAAFEPRLSAALLNGGIMDTHAAFVGQFPPEWRALYNAKNKTGFDAVTQAALLDHETPSSLRWGMYQGLWAFKMASPYDWLEEVRQYSLKDVINQIKVPVWIANPDREQFFAGQPKQVADALGDLAYLHNFTGAAGYHCESGAYAELTRGVFAFLHEALG